MISYQEWLDWRKQPITEMFYEACMERINEAKDVLAFTAGMDQLQDNMYRGFIRAYLEMLEFKVENPSEEELPEE